MAFPLLKVLDETAAYRRSERAKRTNQSRGSSPPTSGMCATTVFLTCQDGFTTVSALLDEACDPDTAPCRAQASRSLHPCSPGQETVARAVALDQGATPRPGISRQL